MIARKGVYSAIEDHSSRFPSFEEFKEFLAKRTHILKMSEQRATAKDNVVNESKEGVPMIRRAKRSQTTLTINRIKRAFHAEIRDKCTLCTKAHVLMHCPEYLAKSTKDRRQLLRDKKRCFNFMGLHRVDACKSTYQCKICQGKHHTSVHQDEVPTRRVRRGGGAKTRGNYLKGDESKRELKAYVTDIVHGTC